MYIWLFSRSDGAGNATRRNTRGLTRSVIARIVPPLPAASRPSKTTIRRSPLYFTQSCNLQSSPCSRLSSFSYFLRLRDCSSRDASCLDIRLSLSNTNEHLGRPGVRIQRYCDSPQIHPAI